MCTFSLTMEGESRRPLSQMAERQADTFPAGGADDWFPPEGRVDCYWRKPGGKCLGDAQQWTNRLMARWAVSPVMPTKVGIHDYGAVRKKGVIAGLRPS
jgi:hypothetical protein